MVLEKGGRYKVQLEADVMVAARDGVTLATDIYFPAEDGKRLEGRHPVVMQRTPYNKTESERGLRYAQYFASHGYIAIVQDCRGCYGSGGEVNFLQPEAEDGFDTLQWIKNQPWAGEKVGTWGTSWAGWTQVSMAGLGPDNLGTMIPNVCGANAYTSSVRQGGALEMRWIAWAYWHSAQNTQATLTENPWITPALNLDPTLFRDWLTRWPIRKGQTQLKLVPAYEKWVMELMNRADYDDYWATPSMNPSAHWQDFPDMPVLYVGGWYDSYTRGTLESFVGNGALKNGPVRVLIGPWTHGAATMQLSYAGDVEFGEDAALDDFREIHKRWFDSALLGEGDGWQADVPVRIFVMGGGGGHKSGAARLYHGGQWRDEQEWPLSRTEFRDFHLHGDGSLAEQAPTEKEASTTFQYDPSNPVPSIGGNVSSLNDLAPMPEGVSSPDFAPRGARNQFIMAPGGFDQVESDRFLFTRQPFLPLGSRRDVVVYETEPLEADTEVTGPIDVTLWVSTDSLDTDFTAKLIDVYPPSEWYPNGFHLNISDSIQRLRYRNNDGIADLVTPGDMVEITITLYPTSNLFVTGHRIRLDISSSNFPRFDINPNSGEAIGRERLRKVARNTIHHDSDHPSRITLPIIPAA